MKTLKDVIDIYSRWDGKSPLAERIAYDLFGAKIVHATYDTGDYEGGWLVVYRKGEKWFVDKGSHCSCNGPEWNPKETTPEALLSADFYTYYETDEAAFKANIREEVKCPPEK